MRVSRVLQGRLIGLFLGERQEGAINSLPAAFQSACAAPQSRARRHSPPVNRPGAFDGRFCNARGLQDRASGQEDVHPARAMTALVVVAVGALIPLVAFPILRHVGNANRHVRKKLSTKEQIKLRVKSSKPLIARAYSG